MQFAVGNSATIIVVTHIALSPEEDKERASTDRYNKEELVDLLRSSGEKVVELYGVWDGDFEEPPEAQETIAVDQILDPAFRFKERGFYKVAVEYVDE